MSLTLNSWGFYSTEFCFDRYSLDDRNLTTRLIYYQSTKRKFWDPERLKSATWFIY